MGKDLYDNNAVAKELFEKANEIHLGEHKSTRLHACWMRRRGGAVDVLARCYC